MPPPPQNHSAAWLPRRRGRMAALVGIAPIAVALALAATASALSRGYPAAFDRLQGPPTGAAGVPAVGQIPPPFTLQSTTHRWTTLRDLPRPTLLVFYLGSTCPHCVRQFLMLSDHAAALAAHHVRVAGISSDMPMESLFFSVRSNLSSMTLLSDPDHAVAARYGLCHPGGTVPLHACFLIDRTGRIVWESVGELPLMNFAPLGTALARLP